LVSLAVGAIEFGSVGVVLSVGAIKLSFDVCLDLDGSPSSHFEEWFFPHWVSTINYVLWFAACVNEF